MTMKKKYSGFTLIELLLGMSLTVLVGGILYLMQSTGMATVKKGATKLFLTSKVRIKDIFFAFKHRNYFGPYRANPKYIFFAKHIIVYFLTKLSVKYC